MKSQDAFSRVAIVGLGLMGGSAAAAINYFDKGCTVAGVDYPQELEKAIDRGIIDRGFQPERLEKAVRGSELVILATPVATIIDLVRILPEHLEQGGLVTDFGSTKRAISQAGTEAFSDSDAHFIGGHPMTGSETTGIEGAHPLLFENSIFVLTPSENVPTAALNRLADFVKGLGAEPLKMRPEEHDRIAARVSHLPQLLATTLVNFLNQGQSEEKRKGARLAGGGFRDMTRIADSPYKMWEDIFLTNEQFIQEEADKFLEEFKGLIEDFTPCRIRESFRSAGELRSNLGKGGKGFSSSLHRVAVMVPDRPAALADITAKIAEEGLNIRDLELQKVREDYGGTFHIMFASRDAAEAAAVALNDDDYQARLIKQ
ncbi:MAG: prephenate dehydrogenase/arogenate dehydrogenase family protein [Candidatus Acetothermia bacterium]